MKKSVFGFSGEKFEATIIYVVKHKFTREYIAAFSEPELAENFKRNILGFREDELFIQATILDYLAH